MLAWRQAVDKVVMILCAEWAAANCKFREMYNIDTQLMIVGT
jgi:hypothetical protein